MLGRSAQLHTREGALRAAAVTVWALRELGTTTMHHAIDSAVWPENDPRRTDT